jgi:hypothetical protein
MIKNAILPNLIKTLRQINDFKLYDGQQVQSSLINIIGDNSFGYSPVYTSEVGMEIVFTMQFQLFYLAMKDTKKDFVWLHATCLCCIKIISNM